MSSIYSLDGRPLEEKLLLPILWQLHCLKKQQPRTLQALFTQCQVPETRLKQPYAAYLKKLNLIESDNTIHETIRQIVLKTLRQDSDGDIILIFPAAKL